MILMISQYSLLPLSFLKPPDIFWCDLHFRRSRSESLLWNFTSALRRNRRWLFSYFVSRLSRVNSSDDAYLFCVFRFCSYPLVNSSSNCFMIRSDSSSVKKLFCRISSLRRVLASDNRRIISVLHEFPVSSEFFLRYRSK